MIEKRKIFKNEVVWIKTLEEEEWIKARVYVLPDYNSIYFRLEKFLDPQKYNNTVYNRTRDEMWTDEECFSMRGSILEKRIGI